MRACGLSLDYGHMMAESIGAEHGLRPAELRTASARARAAVDAVGAAARAGALGFAKLPFALAVADEVRRVSDEIASEVDTFVVLGIGGSALGPIALHAALNHPFHNLLSRAGRAQRPRVFVLDNVDPEFIAGAMDVLDLKKTAVNVVTKSGSTAETMAQCLLFLKAMGKRLGAGAMRRRVVVTTDPEHGALRALAMREGYRLFSIPPDVGGRFSVLSPVGLLSAAVSGIDVRELLEGARAAHDACVAPDLSRNPAMALALLQYLSCAQRGKTIAVMMPYASALAGVSDWFRQLWAESLGKRVDRAGTVVHAGQTPVKALGATDQHSQIQLYMEGPADKVVTFLGVGGYRRMLRIPPSPLEDDALDYLGGKTMDDLIRAEQRATALALARAGRPSMTLTLNRVSPRSVGMLLYVFEMQTAIAAELYGINAFDQPGVEEGKRLTYAMMGRAGYGSLRREIARVEKRCVSRHAVELR